MEAFRAPCAFDGERFLDGGATVLVDAGRIVAVESGEHPLPRGCRLQDHPGGTLLPGLIESHAHLVCDGRPGAVERVGGADAEELASAVEQALAAQLAAGVTTVRDLGDRDFLVLDRRDRRASGAREPAIVASGPPLTSPGGHCAGFGGEVRSRRAVEAAVAERVERGVDVVKVMASGGLYSPGTDVEQTQFDVEELRTVVDTAHAAGLPVTAHAHALTAVEQALTVGVDGIEHCTCLGADGFGGPPELLERLAGSGVAVSLTLGGVPGTAPAEPPVAIAATLAAHGWTLAEALERRRAWFARVCASDVRLVAGADSGVGPGKPHGVLPRAVLEHVELGLPLERALAAATSTAADVCGLPTRGRLRPGCDADLLVVDGDLRTDPGALLRPRLVHLAGDGRPTGSVVTVEGAPAGATVPHHHRRGRSS